MSVTGLRERKKAATSRAISDAALRLALDRGPAAVTVDDIAAAANVSARTVFNYFGTKEAAILGIDPERRRNLLERVEARPASEPPLTALRAGLGDAGDGANAVTWRTRARLARDHPQQLQSAYIASFIALEDDLTGALGRRLGIDPDIDPYPRLVVAAAIAALRVATDHAIANQLITDLDAIVGQGFAALAAGLPAPFQTAR